MNRKQRLADILTQTEQDGCFLPGRAQSRADCKVLVKQGRLEPNGCMGYRIPAQVCAHDEQSHA